MLSTLNQALHPFAPRAWISICLWLALGSLGFANQNESSEQALSDLRQRMAALQAQLDAELKQKNQAMAELAELTRTISDLNQSLNANLAAQQALGQEIAVITPQQSERKEKINELLAGFNRLLLSGYPVQAQTSLKLILNQDSPHRAARVWAYHRRLSQASTDLINRLATEMASLDQLTQELQSKQQNLADLKESQQAQLAILNDSMDARRQTLAEIDRQISSNTQALEELKEDEKRLERVLSQARQESARLLPMTEPPNVMAEKGRLPMPTRGRLRVGFGQPRSGSTPWRGWILETEPKASVHAIGAGRVIYADWLRGYGLLIIIDHQDELLTLYAHNETLYFNVGDWVRAGETIATVGQPNLPGTQVDHGSYFELRQGGQAKDPAVWIDRNRLPQSAIP